MITVPAFAKINLCLCVGGRQPDGYHAIDTIFHSLSLHDEVHLEPAERTSLVVDGPYAEGVPTDESNLALKAARRLGAEVAIRLTKHIPAGSGLGGGSADAAAVLTGLNHLLDRRLSDAELHALAGQLGSDVPFALRGGTARGWGRGERLASIPAAAPLFVVLVLPGFAVSTAWCYQEWSRMEKRAAAPNLTPPGRPGGDTGAIPEVGNLTVMCHPRPFTSPSYCGGLAQALLGRRMREVYQGLHNDLERVAFAAHPDLPEIKAKLLQAGCVAAAMTGSGSAVFGLAESLEAAYRIADTLHVDGRVVVTRSRDGGETS
ncbi:MAG: 4-(cytidine 5'-diphospho)-2-C-methyl-D-erythritol kinase [Candidatus Xenobia bacterium]